MRDMTVQQSGRWLCPWVAIAVVLLSHSLGGVAAAPLQEIYHDYTYNSLQEVADIPTEGTTRLCVVPLDDNTRMKVRHTDADGGRQEVLLKRKSLSADTLSVLEIEVETDGADKPILSVSLNGQLQGTAYPLRTTNPTALLPRTALLLKGKARVAKCAAAAESVSLGSEAKQMMVAEPAGQGGGKVTEWQGGEIVTEGQGEKVTEGQGEKLTEGQGDKVTEGQGDKVTEGQGDKVTEGQGDKVTEGQGDKVTEGQGDKVTEGQGKMTDGQGGDEVSSNASVPSLPSSASTSVSGTTEDPESGVEEPWWSFLLVLGKVGKVPVLLLLLACLLIGVVVGIILVCMCSKVCQKRRVEYLPVSTKSIRSGQLAGDIIRDSKFWDTLSSKNRSSGIGSTYSTLNTDNGSHMGTTNSRGTGTRSAGSANNSIDRSTRGPMNIGVNNLGRGSSGSPSSTTNRSRNNSSGNVLNIPQGIGMTRSSSSKSTGSPDNRDVDRSPLSQGGRVARTSSNKSTTSSINRNTNRSPNIPYNNKLGIFAGHQDAPLSQKPSNKREGMNEDSDDSNYDKPYISPPIVAENYSVPHGSTAQPVLVELRTTTTSTNDPSSRQVPVYEFGTFKK